MGLSSIRPSARSSRRRSTCSRPRTPDLAAETARAILVAAWACAPASAGSPVFRRMDGGPARVERHAKLLEARPLGTDDQRYVLQVSRWDSLKDPIGVIDGFVEHVVAQHGRAPRLRRPGRPRRSRTTPRARRSTSTKRGGARCRPRLRERRAPRAAADERRRRERRDRQRRSSGGRGGRAEEPRRGLRAHRRRGDVEAPAVVASSHRRHPGPDRRRASAACCSTTRKTAPPSAR